MPQEVSNRILTIPNLLSVIRLLLLPVFFVLLVRYENNFLAFIILLAASLTDAVDGFIARITNSVSRLGQWLDPLVDRVFIGFSIVAIFLVGRMPLWILVLLFARDACMLALTIYQKRRFNRGFKVIFLGKLTTAILMVGFCSLVLLWPMLPGLGLVELRFLPGWGAAQAPGGLWLLYAGVILSIITAGIYLRQGVRPNTDDGLAMALKAQKGQKEKLGYSTLPTAASTSERRSGPYKEPKRGRGEKTR
ncbi:MAG: CDP-alcohol phosphatidyltransferase family protein [Coriobacteriia bacterium]|nr:CDP-alcohol phosphatidyltransferase family protein [Coriobacteriia bacterium]